MPESSYLYGDEPEPGEIEAYCVRCRQTVVMLNPVPVWTRRGTPGTRGECDICGTTVFRMGRTEAHNHIAKPGSIRAHLMGPAGEGAQKRRLTAYINYSPADIYFASRLAEDLSTMGVPVWFDPRAGQEAINWATGVHPALDECRHMVVVLSGDALQSEDVARSLAFFREQRKPVVVAQIAPCEVPDSLRRYPRYDFNADYRAAFRQLIQRLAG